MKDGVITVHNRNFRLFISRDEIREKIAEGAIKLRTEYADKNPLFLSILNGSFIFAADLIRAIDFPCEVSFVRLASYAGMETSGKVEVVYGVNTAIRDRHIVIVEDIVDTGSTLNFFLPMLEERNAASVSIVSLLLKPDNLEHQLPLKWVGFEIPNKFVIGYGLDFDEQGRYLEDIYQLDE